MEFRPDDREPERRKCSYLVLVNTVLVSLGYTELKPHSVRVSTNGELVYFSRYRVEHIVPKD